MRLRTALVSFAICACASSVQARIDTLYCEPRDTLRDLLTTEYGAQMTGQGVRGPDVILEIWSVPDNGSWTLVQTYANGQACIVAMGEHWENKTAAPEPS